MAQTTSGGSSGVGDLSLSLDRPSRVILIARATWRGFKLALEAAALLALLALLFVRLPQVTGRSMEPQLRADEHVLINTLAYGLRIGAGDRPLVDLRARPIRRGDVVAFDHVVDGVHRVYVKRVVGLPGDSIAIAGGSVLIDGTPAREAYAVTRDATNMSPQRVGADAYFVLGDNRAESDDSRAFGAVPRGAVIGRAAMVVWPLNRAGPIR